MSLTGSRSTSEKNLTQENDMEKISSLEKASVMGGNEKEQKSSLDVSRLEAKTDNLGFVDQQSAASLEAVQDDFPSDDAAYRNHWESAYGQSGNRYEDYDLAYRYGSTAAGDVRYTAYRWDEAEPLLRSDWESSHPDSAWDKVKDAVRYGVERVKHAVRH
jgi:hypothetical protein